MDRRENFLLLYNLLYDFIYFQHSCESMTNGDIQILMFDKKKGFYKKPIHYIMLLKRKSVRLRNVEYCKKICFFNSNLIH